MRLPRRLRLLAMTKGMGGARNGKKAGLDNFNKSVYYVRNSSGLGYYKLLGIRTDSYQALDDRHCN
jgi:hypothetical protein